MQTAGKIHIELEEHIKTIGLTSTGMKITVTIQSEEI